MARATTDYKRLFAQSLKWDAEDGKAPDFIGALKIVSRARYADTVTGRVLIGTSGNGRTVTFAVPQAGFVNATVVAELCGEMLRRYDQAKADLVAAGNATPSDDQIYAELVGGLVAVTESYFDASEIRLPNNFTKIQDQQ